MGAPEIYDALQEWLKAGPWSGGLRRFVVAMIIIGGAYLLSQALRMVLDLRSFASSYGSYCRSSQAPA